MTKINQLTFNDKGLLKVIREHGVICILLGAGCDALNKPNYSLPLILGFNEV